MEIRKKEEITGERRIQRKGRSRCINTENNEEKNEGINNE
jgi:hypothetical protein